MAFNNFLTPSLVAPNGNISWWYTFGASHGAQAASAMVVVTENGQLQGFAHGSKAEHTARHTAQKDHAGLPLLPGQEMHEVDVPDEFATVTDG